MWESNFVEIPSLKVHYTRTGGDKQPIILAHGITDNGLCWTDVAQVLQDDFDVIMLDARGHGESDAPETGNDWTVLADDIKGVIDALQLEKPIVLGHSMGALTALILAGKYTDTAKAILLEDPPAMWVAQSNDAGERAEGIRDWILSLQNANRDELLENQKKETPHWTESELENWADSKVQVSTNVAEIVGTNRDFSSIIANVTCPVLLIRAEPTEGAIITEETAAQLQSLVPQVKVEYVAGAGHSIHRDKFDDYMRVVQAYLQQI